MLILFPSMGCWDCWSHENENRNPLKGARVMFFFFCFVLFFITLHEHNVWTTREGLDYQTIQPFRLVWIFLFEYGKHNYHNRVTPGNRLSL